MKEWEIVMASEVWDDPNKQVQMLSFPIGRVFMVEWKPVVYCKKPGVGITLWGPMALNLFSHLIVVVLQVPIVMKVLGHRLELMSYRGNLHSFR